MRRFHTVEANQAYDQGYAAGIAAAKNREPLDLAKIKAMTPEQVQERLPEVNDFMAGRS